MKNIFLLYLLVSFGFDAVGGPKSERKPARAHTARPSRHVMWNELEQPNHAVVGYLGVYHVGLYPLPIVIGADFRMTLPSDSRIALRGGLLHWSASGWGRGVSVSMLEVSGGGGFVWTIKRVEIEGGGRLGYDTFNVSSRFEGWDVFSKSGSSLVLAPYASATFKFTKEWSAGVEVRIPYYFAGGGVLPNQPYILSQGQFHF